MLFAQGCIVLEDRRMVNKGGHLLMRAIGGGTIGSRGGTIGGRSGAVGSRGWLVVVDRLGLWMVHCGLWLVHMMGGQGGGSHMMYWSSVMYWSVMYRGSVTIAGGRVGVSLLPGVQRDLGNGDGVTRYQGVAEIM